MRPRVFFGVLAIVSAAAACSLTQSLDYLQEGPGIDDGGGDVVDASTDATIFAPPVTIAAAQSRPSSLCQDVDNLYWLDASGEVRTVPKAGGQARSIGTIAAPPVTRLAADVGIGGFLYAIAGTAVRRLAKTGGTAETILTAAVPPAALVADSSLVFLIEDKTVVRIGSDGGARTTLVRAQDAVGLAVAGPNVLWANKLSGFDGEFTIRSVPKDAVPDASPQVFNPSNQMELSFGTFAALAADTEAAYYAESDIVSRLLTVPMPGRLLQIYLSQHEEQNAVDSIAVDDQFLYVTENEAQGIVARAPKIGGPVEIIARVRQPTSVIVDNRAIYFLLVGASQNDGAVMSVTKP